MSKDLFACISRQQKHKMTKDNKDNANKKAENIPTKICMKEGLHRTVSALVSMVPIVGGPAQELFNTLVSSPLGKRRDDWLNDIALMINELKEKEANLDISSLSNNEQFISAVLQATQIVLKNHQIEKKKALINAIKHIALCNAPEDDIQSMFLNYIDTLTPWHLRLLEYFRNPRKWGEQHGVHYPDWISGSQAKVLETTFPELEGKREIYTKLYTDLCNYGLVKGESLTTLSLHTAMTGEGMFQSMTTTFGNKFLDFISE